MNSLRLLPFLGFAALLTACNFVPPPSVRTERSITVSGVTAIKTNPDQMQWVLLLQLNEETEELAKTKHDASLQAIQTILQTLSDSLHDLKIGGSSVTKRTFTNRNEKPFDDTTAITFTLTNLDKFTDLSDQLSKIEGVQIEQTDLSYSHEAETREQARTEALKIARAKAQSMAAALDCTLGPPLRIREEEPDTDATSGHTTSDALPGGPVPPSGEVEITAKCEVDFELKDK